MQCKRSLHPGTINNASLGAIQTAAKPSPLHFPARKGAPQKTQRSPGPLPNHALRTRAYRAGTTDNRALPSQDAMLPSATRYYCQASPITSPSASHSLAAYKAWRTISLVVLLPYRARCLACVAASMVEGTLSRSLLFSMNSKCRNSLRRISLICCCRRPARVLPREHNSHTQCVMSTLNSPLAKKSRRSAVVMYWEALS